MKRVPAADRPAQSVGLSADERIHKKVRPPACLHQLTSPPYDLQRHTCELSAYTLVCARRERPWSSLASPLPLSRLSATQFAVADKTAS